MVILRFGDRLTSIIRVYIEIVSAMALRFDIPFSLRLTAWPPGGSTPLRSARLLAALAVSPTRVGRPYGPSDSIFPRRRRHSDRARLLPRPGTSSSPSFVGIQYVQAAQVVSCLLATSMNAVLPVSQADSAGSIPVIGSKACFSRFRSSIL